MEPADDHAGEDAVLGLAAAVSEPVAFGDAVPAATCPHPVSSSAINNQAAGRFTRTATPANGAALRFRSR
jgi:hypothetical protein